MPSFRKRITLEAVKALKPGEMIWDTRIAGFGVRCQKRERVFVYKYRFNNVQRWLSIGAFGAPYTVDDAIRKVRAAQRDIEIDLDPARVRDDRARNPTVAQAGDEYLAEEISKRAKATQIQYSDFMRRLVYPALGATKVADVTYSDLTRLHGNLRNTQPTANRVLAVLSGFFNWCERQNYRSRNSNPTTDVTKYAEKGRERFLSPRELARLGIALSRAERDRTASVYAIAAIRLLMLTGCRRNEILTLQWKDVRLDGKPYISLPESKTGSRTVYLSKAAVEILSALPRVRGNPYVIVGHKEKARLVNLRKTWMRICKVARIREVRLHDLRHSFASFVAQEGHSLQVIGKLLGHSKASTTEKYSHLASDPVRDANEMTGQRIADMLAKKLPRSR